MIMRFTSQLAWPSFVQSLTTACIAALISVALRPSTALAVPGDMNCDNAVNAADIPLFVDALLANGSFGGCDINRADMNADALINGRDMQRFVAALSCPEAGQPCGCTDTNWDALNCGSCGHACQPTEYCSYGECYGTCIGCEP